MRPFWIIVLLQSIWVYAATQVPSTAGPGPANKITSMVADSPFTGYTAHVVVYILIVEFLVVSLLIGAFVAVNIAFLSKPSKDRIGKRSPSDVGVLKDTVWPEEKTGERVLPAEESSQEGEEEKPAA